MIRVPVKTGGITFPTGTNDLGTPQTIETPYAIGKTEVSWTTWKTVFDWATTDAGNGLREDGGPLYIFANPGSMGSEGEGHPEMTGDHPVTMINWRDAIVWCNALTEYCNDLNDTNLQCVYYADENYRTPIRESSNEVKAVSYLDMNYHPGIHETESNLEDMFDLSEGSIDNPYIRSSVSGNTDMAMCSADGYRLPTQWEWEMSARWLGKRRGRKEYALSSEFGREIQELTSGYNWTPGNFASGAEKPFDDTKDVNNDGIVDGKQENDRVAVYSSYYDKGWIVSGTTSTRETGSETRSPNALGIYDMSGNVWELCHDWLNPWNRCLRGGSWSNSAMFLQTGYRSILYAPYEKYDRIGFRVARNAH